MCLLRASTERGLSLLVNIRRLEQVKKIGCNALEIDAVTLFHEVWHVCDWICVGQTGNTFFNHVIVTTAVFLDS